MRPLVSRLLAGVALLALTGCPYSYTANDAGDAAWVEQVVPALLGRKPINAVESQVLVDILQASGREAVVDVLMSLPEFDDYWSIVLADALEVQRSGVAQANSTCFTYYAYPLASSADGNVANVLSTQPDPTAATGLPTFSLVDVLRSSIAEDDLFAAWRFTPYVLAPLTRGDWDNVGKEVFLSSHTNRSAMCLDCHTADYSAAAISPFPMMMDQALFAGGFGSTAERVRFLFGEETGAGAVAAVFGGAHTSCANRLTGMASEAHGGTPGGELAGLHPSDDPSDCAWNNSGPGCESLDLLDLDAAMFAGRNAADMALVSTGFGTTYVPSGWFTYPGMTGDEALGTALALTVTEAIVEELEGHGYTLPHGQPRVDDARYALQGWASMLVGSGWSLRVPLKSLVLAGTFNMRPPSQSADDYPFAMFFNPWALDGAADDAYDNVNGVGDVVHRFSVPALLRTVYHSLGWAEPAIAPSGSYPSKTFQRDLGRYESYEEKGFEDVTYQSLLLWEEQVGTCDNPGVGMDWVDYAVQEAQSNPSYTLEDVLLGFKDRFIQESDIDDGWIVVDDDVISTERIADDGGGIDWSDYDEIKAWASEESERRDERSAQRAKARAYTATWEATVARGEALMEEEGRAAAEAKEDPDAWRERYDDFTKWLGDAKWAGYWSQVRDDVDEDTAYRTLEAYGESMALWGPAVYQTEADKLEDYFGVASLGVSASTVPDLEDLLRGYCGVLTTTPQYLLGGMRRVQTAPDPVPDFLVCLPSQADYCDEVDLCNAYNPYLTAAGYPALTC